VTSVPAEPLAEADALARCIAYLNAHPQVLDVLGGARVGPYNRPPYPCVRATDPPGGDDLDLRWITRQVVKFEVFGDLEGAPGKPALKRIAKTILGVLRDLPDVPTEPGQSVVTDVRPSGGGGWAPDPTTGQPKYDHNVLVTIHPPQVPRNP
jgi:hypothetical protein